MKQTRLAKMLAAIAACALATSVLAQSTTTTTTATDPATGTTTTAATTTTSAGTIVGYTPDADYITFRTTTGAAPVRYYYTKSTTIADPEGHTISWSALHPDTPATVYYATEGDRTIVRKIVVNQPAAVYEKRETTTTTTTEKP